MCLFFATKYISISPPEITTPFQPISTNLSEHSSLTTNPITSPTYNHNNVVTNDNDILEHSNHATKFFPKALKFWVVVQLGQSCLMGKCASLTLVGHPSSAGFTIKIPYGVDVLLH